MKGLYIGTGMVICGCLLLPLFVVMGIPLGFAKALSIGIACVGFFIQIRWAFLIRAHNERELQKTREGHEALMKEVQGMPPEEAIKKLLKG